MIHRFFVLLLLLPRVGLCLRYRERDWNRFIHSFHCSQSLLKKFTPPNISPANLRLRQVQKPLPSTRRLLVSVEFAAHGDDLKCGIGIDLRHRRGWQSLDAWQPSVRLHWFDPWGMFSPSKNNYPSNLATRTESNWWEAFETLISTTSGYVWLSTSFVFFISILVNTSSFVRVCVCLISIHQSTVFTFFLLTLDEPTMISPEEAENIIPVSKR